MIIRIKIGILVDGEEKFIMRLKDWEVDGDHLDKGEEIEEMMSTLLDKSEPPF